MQVSVGYAEHDETSTVGFEAAQQALRKSGRNDPCDLVLLFSTSAHDPHRLRDAVATAVGPHAAIIGGAAIGAITNNDYGYGSDQVGLAAIWLENDVKVNLFVEGNLADNEKAVGYRLGKSMAQGGVKPETPTILLYDAINRTKGELHLNLATPLLQGMEESLGFLPDNLVGAGLQGNFESSSTMQWNGPETITQSAMMLSFSEELRIDSVIMHGCRPSGRRYEVTKAEGQTILEVDGKPALSYMVSQLQPSLPAEEFPFFMIFGVNRGIGNDLPDSHQYANRLCLAIDKKRDAIVMFESDMVEGTIFQVMYRSLDLDYIPPKINALFEKQASRRPIFAFYIDCAGRTGGRSMELEDAIVVQEAVNNRVPLLGIYSGVEIAPLMGKPRTLDWTGVFCLFSVAK